ncbi:hypothetical protein [uncultured Cohaesibacter sp.]|uniref:hypothetical protein n=1 Tax=uncultured Cohaesibacter sp. TaxID=1002546 RepID=UPI00292FDB23|nr:hypothetical protein [uncultured Cohaesibacter sp.]
MAQRRGGKSSGPGISKAGPKSKTGGSGKSAQGRSGPGRQERGPSVQKQGFTPGRVVKRGNEGNVNRHAAKPQPDERPLFVLPPRPEGTDATARTFCSHGNRAMGTLCPH